MTTQLRHPFAPSEGRPMDLTLTAEQRALQESLRDMFRDACPPAVVRE